ncbi:MAG: putative nucleotidyltransferase component of viral defense system [Glaciecola sp.]|jgi:predicted nucleotidyltransferase component of viral defense system
MIRPKELHKTSNAQGVRPVQIEKDYIISWMLWGIAKNEFLNAALIFKGGTCLKKIHIEDYRYSEDMDFTINPEMENEITDDEIYQAFDTVFSTIKEATNMNLSIPDNSKDIHDSSGSIKFYIDYIGPLEGNGGHLKMDVTRGEKLEFDTIKREVKHDYSDLNEEDDFKVQSYSLEEVVIEKMAALMGRTVPRDLYYFEYLTNNEGIELQDVYYEFERKAKHKGQNPSEFTEKVTDKMKKFESAWEANLSHQIKNLPKFKDVWRGFGKQLRALEKCT